MFTKITKLVVVILVLTLGVIQTTNAAYPEKPIKIIVPFAAGGNTDTIARIVADHISGAVGQPVIVEDRPGGGATIGVGIAKDAKPDGYTLLFATAGSHSINPYVHKKLKYDPIKDFEPVSVAVISSVLIVVHPSVPANTLQELIKLTSSGKVQYNYASGGMGTLSHVCGALYNEKTGSKLNHVPYKGASEALNDVVAGRIQVYMNNLPTTLSHVRSGAVRPLALGAPKRSKLLPDVPTTSEAGMQGMEMGSWFGLLAPKGAPAEAVNRLFEAMKSMEGAKQVQERLLGVGCEVTVSESPKQFREYMQGQLKWWGDILNRPEFKK